MDAEKYNRQITLLCPTCGSSQFEHDEEVPNHDDKLYVCASCGLELTKETLISENQENISEHVQEIGEQVTADLKDELQKSFGGFKNITLKL